MTTGITTRPKTLLQVCRHAFQSLVNFKKAIAPISQLPDELLCYILYGLDLQTLTNVALVNKRWSACAFEMVQASKRDEQCSLKVALFRIRNRSLFFKQPKSNMRSLLDQAITSPPPLQHALKFDAKTYLYSWMLVEQELHMMTQIMTHTHTQTTAQPCSLSFLQDKNNLLVQLSSTYLLTFGKDFIESVFRVYMYDYLQGSICGSTEDGFRVLVNRFCSLAEEIPQQIKSFLKLIEQNFKAHHLQISCILVISWIAEARKDYVNANQIASSGELALLNNITTQAYDYFADATDVPYLLEKSFVQLKGTLKAAVATQPESLQMDNSGKVNVDLLCRNLERYLASQSA